MEDGRILFYNPHTGLGKLILKSGKKIDFSVDVWDDFESIPKAGLLVECSVERGVLRSLKLLPLHTSTTQIDSFETEVFVLPDEHKGSTYSVSETLQNYFNPVELIIGKPPEVVNTKEQLDYFLSKRFLITAYNNLKGIDSSLHNQKDVKEVSRLLEELSKAYHAVTDKIDVPHLAFEMIFLRAQPEYIQFINDKERCLDSITILSKLVNSLFLEIQKKEAELKRVTNKKIKIELENKLKKLRGRYVDAIHEKANLTEELTEMQDIKVLYTKVYFQPFNYELSLLKIQYKKIISNILNYKAYELDKLIWKHASKSKSVYGYFHNAGIKGNYSTVTYLRYYLKTLDKDKIKEEQEELFKFLDYLEKVQKV